MTQADVRRLLEYHYWARDRMLEALEVLSADQFIGTASGSFGSIRDTAVHIYSADWVWYCRWTGEAVTGMVDPSTFPDVATLRRSWLDLERRVLALVTELGETGMTREISFKTLDGTPAAGVFGQLVQHVVNHGSYHRGQVTTLLRQRSVPPPKSTDMVTFDRLRQAAR